MTLEEAIDFMKIKDDKGLSFIYDKYARALMGIIVRIVSSDKLAEEILQQTFMKIWKGIDSYDSDKSTLFTWMARIARNAAIDQKRLVKFKNDEITDSFDPSIHDVSINVDHSSLDVETLIGNLDPKYKMILEYVYLKGYSHKEVAELTGLPLGTIKTRLRKSISILRDSLKNERVIFTSAVFLIILVTQLL